MTKDDIKLHDILNELAIYYWQPDGKKQELIESGYDIGGLYDLIAIWQFKFNIICCRQTTDECCKELQPNIVSLITGDEFKHRVEVRLNLLRSKFKT
jgi:hypothetical protein